MDVITPDLLTKEIIEAFIKKIIVVDKTTVVMVIDSAGEIEPKAIKKRRKEIANRESILTKEVLLDRHFRPETLTKPIVNTCLQAIIVVNRHELVFVLPNNEKANYLYIKEKRANLVQHTPLLEGDVTLERRYRNEHLHYKVVMV